MQELLLKMGGAYTQGGADLPDTTVLLSGTWPDPNQAFLVVDKHVVCEVSDLFHIPL